MQELSTASNDDDDDNEQRFTSNVKSSNRQRRKQLPVKMADKPDEYDYDSSDEEVICNICQNY
jgi:hypothetical protein